MFLILSVTLNKIEFYHQTNRITDTANKLLKPEVSD